MCQQSCELFEIILTFHADGPLLRAGKRRKKQGSENGDDGDDDEQFNQCEREKFFARSGRTIDVQMGSHRACAGLRGIYLRPACRPSTTIRARGVNEQLTSGGARERPRLWHYDEKPISVLMAVR